MPAQRRCLRATTCAITVHDISASSPHSPTADLTSTAGLVLGAPSLAKAQSSEQLNWRMTNAYSPGSPLYVEGPGSPRDVIAKINAMSGGRLNIQHFAAGELILWSKRCVKPRWIPWPPKPTPTHWYAQVRVDVFYERFPAIVRRITKVIGGLLLLVMGLYIAWLTLPWVEQSYLRNETSPNPGGLPFRWLLKSFIPLGFLLLALQGLATGMICASDTLGQIILPSLVLILLAEILGESVGTMFAAPPPAFRPGTGAIAHFRTC